MALSAFDDKLHPPTEADLAEVLGKSYTAWKKLQQQVTTRFAPALAEWGCSGKSTGWGLRLKKKDRAILYMVPCRGYFLASFALGEKAVKAAQASDLPDAILKTIEAAPKYAEGRGVRIEVRTVKDVRSIEILADIKMAN
jgi:hypothetical protein